MMTPVLILWMLNGPSMTLPVEIDRVDKIIRHGEALYILDRPSNCVTKCNQQGEALQVYDHNGEGPGEYYKLTGMAMVGQEVYLSDFNGKMIVTDLDLKFIREHKIDLRIWDLEASEKGFYMVGFNGASQKMVSLFDRNFKRNATFGDRLKNSPKGYHLDNGSLTKFGNHFFFVHFFILGIQAFSAEGELLYTSYPPNIKGAESALLFSGKGRNVNVSRAIKKVSCTRDGVICLYKRKDELDGWEAFRFSTTTRKWLAPVNDPTVVVSDLTYDYLITRDDQDRIRMTVQN